MLTAIVDAKEGRDVRSIPIARTFKHTSDGGCFPSNLGLDNADNATPITLVRFIEPLLIADQEVDAIVIWMGGNQPLCSLFFQCQPAFPWTDGIACCFGWRNSTGVLLLVLLSATLGRVAVSCRACSSSLILASFGKRHLD